MKPIPILSNYDLVHIFNIQNVDHSLKQVLNAKNMGVPIVLSTIYWDFSYYENLKESHLYSPYPIVRNLARINLNIPHYILKLLFYNKNKTLRKKIKLILQESDLLLPNSYSELEIIAILFKMPEIRQKALIIHNGISKYENDNSSSNTIKKKLEFGTPYVLEVAKLHIIKGQLNLIKSLFDYPEIPLVFIGEGLETTYGKKCIELGKKRTNTYFLGKIPHEDIYEYYSNAKVHVLPSLRESPGLTTLEAAISGVNCVISIHTPVLEYFGLNTFCCDPLNIKSIKNAVLEAWNSPNDNQLKNRLLKNFTWKKAAIKTLEAYNFILNDDKIKDF